jgi:phosphoribosyl-AMP cyclohydrolase / phosphoribosyl-ATP pyrophosphohydrolase
MSPDEQPGVLTSTNADNLRFDKGSGLIPAIVQDAATGAVLMLGYMNREALNATFERGRVVFFSRSKQRLWMKGESSGNYLEVAEVHADCDRDTILITARPAGPACHLGTTTCFGPLPLTAATAHGFLRTLESIIDQRVTQSPEGSYTARLFAQGAKRIAQKVGEEGLEVALAAVAEPDDKVVAETADLLYHLLVLLRSRGVPLSRVMTELESRHTAK